MWGGSLASGKCRRGQASEHTAGGGGGRARWRVEPAGFADRSNKSERNKGPGRFQGFWQERGKDGGPIL